MHRKPRIFSAAIFIAFFAFFNSVLAQPLPGKKDSISSSILNEKRFYTDCAACRLQTRFHR